jgi:hypothetical protein
MDTNSNISSTNGATGNGASASILEATVPPTAPAPQVTVLTRLIRAAIGFASRETDAKFIVSSGRILTSMTGNAAFPAPDPSLATLIAARNVYLAAVSKAIDSRVARTERQQARQAYAVLLRKLAHYVEDVSAGNRAVLLSSGFLAQRSKAPVGPLAVPTNLRFVRGKVSGQAIARCGRADQANAYQWRMAPAATPTAWLPVITTFSAHNVFDGLAPLTTYVVQVCAVGTAGASDWSESAVVTML